MGEWRSRFRRGLVAILTLAVVGGTTTSAVLYMPSEKGNAKDSLVGVSLGSIEDAMEGEWTISQERSQAVAYATDGKSLKGTDAALYNSLKACIEEVASGKETSTEFVFHTKLSQAKLSQVDVNTIVCYLLNDCPFDLYWHDKTRTLENGKEVDGVYCKYYDDGRIVFNFKVSAAYRVTPDDLYTVNTAYMDTVNVAVQKAKSIVDTNQYNTDYDKLLNYRNAICDLVSYDAAALADPLYGNAYQVISVFDDDLYTNVVCEGYAKAFKYLCDMSSFDNDVECYTVTGVTDAGAGAGEHMWNVVTIGGNDGESYLVDVTNCDAGTIGEGTQLFMTDNLTGSVDTGYTYNNGWSSITYQYNGESRAVYGSRILSLENVSHEEVASTQVKGNNDNTGTDPPASEDTENISRMTDPEENIDVEVGTPAPQAEEVPDTTEGQNPEFTFGAERTIDVEYGADSFTKQIVGYEDNRKVTYTSSDSTVATVTKRGKVSILGVGTTVITAEGDDGKKDSYTLNVSPKQLTWDTSELYAVNRQDQIGADNQATLYGEIKLEGLLPDDKDKDSQFSFEGKDYLTGTYEDTVAGSQRVILNWQTEKEIHLTKGGKSENYKMPEGLPEFYGTITTLRKLSDAAISNLSESEDGIKYKLEMEDGISVVPESLEGDRELNTPQKIVSKLKSDLNEQGVSEENIAVYDVYLSWLDQAEGDEEENWLKVTDEKFPEEGLTITLPYPSGMPRGADIVVSHMFVEDMYMSSPGDIEHPDVIEETPDGIKFTVYGLSPIAIGWSEDGSFAGSGNTTDTNTESYQSPNTLPPSGDGDTQNKQTNTDRSPVTGDTMQILIYAVLVALCGATIKGIQALRRTNTKKKH